MHEFINKKKHILVASLVMMFQQKQDEFLIFYWPVRTSGLIFWFSNERRFGIL